MAALGKAPGFKLLEAPPSEPPAADADGDIACSLQVMRVDGQNEHRAPVPKVPD